MPSDRDLVDAAAIVDRLTPHMVEREPETVVAWIAAALAQRTAERDALAAQVAALRKHIQHTDIRV